MKNNKNKKIEVRMTEEEKTIIMDYCSNNNLVLSKLIRELLFKEMENNKWN